MSERRISTLAFLSLFGITAGHTSIETARDALFLQKVPVSHLPALYIGIAAVGLVTMRIRGGTRIDPVVSSLGLAALFTTGFWFLAATPSPPVLYALYIYSGVLASWVAGQLWARLSVLFTLVQAKRSYGIIGTGAVLGAVTGAAVARVWLESHEVRHLLLIGAGLIALTIAPASMLPKAPVEAPTRKQREKPQDWRGVLRDPYVSRILVIVLLTAASGTAIDYVFKSAIVAHAKDPTRIATTLATVSLFSNIGSFVVQSVGVALVMRVLGLHRALYVLPIFVLIGGAGVLTGNLAFPAFSFAAALSLRGADGSLRYSIQKTSLELLFVPLSDAMRARAKPIVDLIGQRGGQAAVSLLILGLSIAKLGFVVPFLIVGFAIIWLGVAYGIRARYLDVFRTTLQRGRTEFSADLPELDLGALETLVSALSSRSDAEVLGALDLLAAQGRKLVPTLVLFHPSKPVVLRALELFVRYRRDDFLPVADRLFSHADPEIRAAALRARVAVDPNPEVLRAYLTDADETLRATAVAALVATGSIDRSALDEHMKSPSVLVRRALARALGEVADSESVEEAVIALAHDGDVATRAAAATAMGNLRSGKMVPMLVEMLEERFVSTPAIDSLAAIGEAAVQALDAVLLDSKRSDEVRSRAIAALARSTSDTGPQRLVERLEALEQPVLLGRLLRALRSARALGRPCELDGARLVAIGKKTVHSLARTLSTRLLLGRLSPTDRTVGGELLEKLLRDEEIEARERLFDVLSLLHPNERFPRIQRGLASQNPKIRASSRELLENVVRPPLRDAVLAIADDIDDGARLRRLGEERREASYDDLVRAIVGEGGAVGALATHHASELGLSP